MKRLFTSPLSIALSLFVIAKCFKPYSNAIHGVFTASLLIGTLFFFAFWLYGIFHLGWFLRDQLKIQDQGIGVDLALSTGVASCLITLLGHLKLIGPQHAWIFISLTFVGPLIYSLRERPSHSFSRAFLWNHYLLRHPFHFLPVLCVLALLLYYGLYLMKQNSLPSTHSDGFIYHLLGPRLWFEAGSFQAFPHAIFTTLCGYWDYLLIWGNALVAESGHRGLIESHIFAQWIHLIPGFFGTWLVLSQIFKTWGTPLFWNSIAIFAAFHFALAGYVIFLPKNDFGSVLWLLSGMSFFLKPHLRITPQEIALAGWLMGLSAASKYSVFLSIGPFMLLWSLFYWKKESFKKTCSLLVPYTFCFLVTFSVILFRNYQWSGNPLIPFGTRFFFSPWLNNLIKHTSESTEPFTLAQFIDLPHSFWLLVKFRINYIKKYQPIFLVFIGLCALFPVTQKFSFFNSKKAQPLPVLLFCISSLGSVLFFFLCMSAPQTPDEGTFRIRYIITSLIFVLGYGVILSRFYGHQILIALDKYFHFRFKPILLRGFRWIFAALIISCSAYYSLYKGPGILQLKSFFKSIHHLQERLYHNMTGGHAKAWLQEHATPSDLIITTGENQFYYISNLKAVNILDCSFFEKNQVPRTTKSLLNTLISLNTRYILDINHFDIPYWSRFSAILNTLIHSAPEAILYNSQNSRVIDPKILLETLEKSCIQPAKLPLNDLRYLLFCNTSSLPESEAMISGNSFQ